MYNLEVFYDSGNNPMYEALVKKLRILDGCLSVEGSHKEQHNIVIATFETEKHAADARILVLASSLSLFPKFKIQIEETGINFDE